MKGVDIFSLYGKSYAIIHLNKKRRIYMKLRTKRIPILFACIICYIIGTVFLVFFCIDLHNIKEKRLAAKNYIAKECLCINYENDKQLDKKLTIEHVTIRATLDTQLGMFVCYDTPEEEISIQDTIARFLLSDGKFQKNHKYTLGVGGSEKDDCAISLIYEWFDANYKIQNYSIIPVIAAIFSLLVDACIFTFILSYIIERKNKNK